MGRPVFPLLSLVAVLGRAAVLWAPAVDPLLNFCRDHLDPDNQIRNTNDVDDGIVWRCLCQPKHKKNQRGGDEALDEVSRPFPLGKGPKKPGRQRAVKPCVTFFINTFLGQPHQQGGRRAKPNAPPIHLPQAVFQRGCPLSRAFAVHLQDTTKGERPPQKQQRRLAHKPGKGAAVVFYCFYSRSPWVGFKNSRHTKPPTAAAMAIQWRAVERFSRRAASGNTRLPTLMPKAAKP